MAASIVAPLARLTTREITPEWGKYTRVSLSPGNAAKRRA